MLPLLSLGLFLTSLSGAFDLFRDLDLMAPDEEACMRLSSCEGRCGKPFSTSDVSTCACDADCSFFGDCCKDYSDICEAGIKPSFLHLHGEVECLLTENLNVDNDQKDVKVKISFLLLSLVALMSK